MNPGVATRMPSATFASAPHRDLPQSTYHRLRLEQEMPKHIKISKDSENHFNSYMTVGFLLANYLRNRLRPNLSASLGCARMR